MTTSYVEQKYTYTHVRELFGYQRFEIKHAPATL